MFKLSILSAALAFSCYSYADPLLNPEIQPADIEYLGAFALSKKSTDGLLNGGRAPAYNPINNSLFVGCTWNQKSKLAEVSIPAPVKSLVWDDLPQATILQSCADISDGTIGSISYDAHSRGTLVDGNGNLITAQRRYYDADCVQVDTHGKQPGLDLSVPNDFSGYYQIGWDITDPEVDPRAFAGYMATVPVEWQSYLGGPAVTGIGGGPIISCSSEGPSLNVFDPDDVGVVNPIPGKTFMYYNYSQEFRDDDPAVMSVADTYFHWRNTTMISGVGIPTGSSTVIFSGHRGDTQCYGDAVACGELCNTNYGTHSYPYRDFLWFFSMLDLINSKNTGTPTIADITPYAIRELTEVSDFEVANGDISGCSTLVGAAFDPAQNIMYVVPQYPVNGTRPVVHMYKVNVPDPYQQCVDNCGIQFPQ